MGRVSEAIEMQHAHNTDMVTNDLRGLLADMYGLYWNDLRQVDQRDMLKSAISSLQDGSEWNDAIGDAVRDWDGQCGRGDVVVQREPVSTNPEDQPKRSLKSTLTTLVIALSLGVVAVDVVTKKSLYYLHERVWARSRLGRTPPGTADGSSEVLKSAR